MSVRALMVCQSITAYTYGSEVRLQCLYKDGESTDFSNATPSGEIRMSITKGCPAEAKFIPGKSYYIDFTEVVAP